MSIAEGFEHQRMVVVPPSAVNAALASPITRRLVVSASGYFPEARNHARIREQGIEENIIILCVSGAGWAQIGQEQVRVGASSVLIVPAGQPHRYGASKESPWTIWWCHVRGTDAAELLSAITYGHSYSVSIRELERVVPFAEHILSELLHDTSPARLVSAAGSAWNLMTHVATDDILRDRGEPVERAIAYLRDTLSTSVRVQELATMVGVSASHLSALFNRATGGGVLAYQTGLRMARARHLLDSTQRSVGEIALEVGYADALYFSRAFRKVQGQSPRQYRSRPSGERSAVG